MISFIEILFQMFPMWVITIINRKGAINVRISQCTWNIRAIYDLDLVGVVQGEDYDESDDDEHKQPEVPVHSWPHAPTQLSRATETENC